MCQLVQAATFFTHMFYILTDFSVSFTIFFEKINSKFKLLLWFSYANFCFIPVEAIRLIKIVFFSSSKVDYLKSLWIIPLY